MAEGGDPEKLLRNMSEDADFDDEIKLTYSKYGVKGVLDNMNAWKEQKVKIAVTNTSSTFIVVIFSARTQTLKKTETERMTV